MLVIGYSLAALIGVAIIFIGSRFLWDPEGASSGFGIPHSPPQSTGFVGWLAVKANRDIVSGLFVFLLMANGPARLLGEFMLLASLIALGDAAIVLRSGGKRALAFGVHGLTALVILAAGGCLIVGGAG